MNSPHPLASLKSIDVPGPIADSPLTTSAAPHKLITNNTINKMILTFLRFILILPTLFYKFIVS